MISVIKDLFSNQVVSAVILTIIGAITKKYIQFHRRDFFSRSSSEQIKAVEWLRTSSVPISDPGNDSNLLIVFYVQIMPDDLVMQLHR
ncbi:hypothetical protein RAF34_05270, partial [Klebsiella pneumoniae]